MAWTSVVDGATRGRRRGATLAWSRWWAMVVHVASGDGCEEVVSTGRCPARGELEEAVEDAFELRRRRELEDGAAALEDAVVDGRDGERPLARLAVENARPWALGGSPLESTRSEPAGTGLEPLDALSRAARPRSLEGTARRGTRRRRRRPGILVILQPANTESAVSTRSPPPRRTRRSNTGAWRSRMSQEASRSGHGSGPRRAVAGRVHEGSSSSKPESTPPSMTARGSSGSSSSSAARFIRCRLPSLEPPVREHRVALRGPERRHRAHSQHPGEARTLRAEAERDLRHDWRPCRMPAAGAGAAGTPVPGPRRAR